MECYEQREGQKAQVAEAADEISETADGHASYRGIDNDGDDGWDTEMKHEPVRAIHSAQQQRAQQRSPIGSSSGPHEYSPGSEASNASSAADSAGVTAAAAATAAAATAAAAAAVDGSGTSEKKRSKKSREEAVEAPQPVPQTQEARLQRVRDRIHTLVLQLRDQTEGAAPLPAQAHVDAHASASEATRAQSLCATAPAAAPSAPDALAQMMSAYKQQIVERISIINDLSRASFPYRCVIGQQLFFMQLHHKVEAKAKAKGSFYTYIRAVHDKLERRFVMSHIKWFRMCCLMPELVHLRADDWGEVKKFMENDALEDVIKQVKGAAAADEGAAIAVADIASLPSAPSSIRAPAAAPSAAAAMPVSTASQSGAAAAPPASAAHAPATMGSTPQRDNNKTSKIRKHTGAEENEEGGDISASTSGAAAISTPGSYTAHAAASVSAPATPTICTLSGLITEQQQNGEDEEEKVSHENDEAPSDGEDAIATAGAAAPVADASLVDEGVVAMDEEAEGEAGVEGVTGVEGEAGGEIEAADANANANANADADANANANADVDADADADANADAETGADAEAGADADVDFDTGAGVGAEAVAETDPQPGARVDTNADDAAPPPSGHRLSAQAQPTHQHNGHKRKRKGKQQREEQPEETEEAQQEEEQIEAAAQFDTGDPEDAESEEEERDRERKHKQSSKKRKTKKQRTKEQSAPDTPPIALSGTQKRKLR